MKVGDAAFPKGIGTHAASVWSLRLDGKGVGFTARCGMQDLGEKGKGSVEFWVAPVQPGRMLYEIEGIAEVEAREAFRLAAAKLSVQTQFVARTVL